MPRTDLGIISRKDLFVVLISTGWLLNGLSSTAQDEVDRTLAKQIVQIESSVIGNAPASETSEQRLSAIETKLFGAPQEGILFDRLTKIRAKIAAASGASSDMTGSDTWPAFSSSQSATSAVTPRVVPDKPAAAGKVVEANPGQEILPDPTTTSSSSSSSSSSTEDGWPTALPRVVVPSTHRKGPLVAEVTENATAANAAFEALKHSSDTEAYDKANEAMTNNNYKLAIKLFNMLAARKPKDPRYCYGSGMAYKADGDYVNAFPELILSWHLGNAKVYDDAVNSLIPVMKKEIDDTFKVTYNHSASEPEAVLNAGTRLWKSGLNSQSVKMFEYVLKNEPLYRGTAAFDLGAVAEHNGDLKLALEYYKWAANENHKLEASAEKSPMLAGEIRKSLNTLPRGYVERAVAETEQKLLHGNTGWNGWNQAVSRPQHWSSEVCPLCGISRTSREYVAGQMEMQ